MPKEEWGTKRVCPTTGTGEVVEIETGKTRMIAADAEDAATSKAKAMSGDEDAVLEDDEDVDVELDDDLLDDDDEEDTVPLEEIADVASEDDES